MEKTLLEQIDEIMNEYKKLNTNEYKNQALFTSINQKTNKFLKDNLEILPENVSELFQFIQTHSNYIQNFSQKNFEKALEISSIAYSHDKTSRYNFFILSSIIDVLAEIKANLEPQEFNRQYKKLEEHYQDMLKKDFFYKNIMEQIDNHHVEYLGVNMALSYSAFLENNNSKCNSILQQQINLYGIDRIIENEEGEKNGNVWFYENISPKYKQFISYVKENFQPKQKKHKI